MRLLLVFLMFSLISDVSALEMPIPDDTVRQALMLQDTDLREMSLEQLEVLRRSTLRELEVAENRTTAFVMLLKEEAGCSGHPANCPEPYRTQMLDAYALLNRFVGLQTDGIETDGGRRKLATKLYREVMRR